MIVRPPMQQVVWMVRHGETDWNVDGRVQGQADEARLTPKGEHQVQRVGQLLRGREIEAVYSSDLTRASRSAQIIADPKGIPVQTDPRLRERAFGSVEGSPTTVLVPELTGLRNGRVVSTTARPPGGESLEEMLQRCTSFLLWLRAHHRGDVVVVAHGGSIRVLRAAAGDAPLDGMHWGTVSNGSVTRLLVPATGWREDPRRSPAPAAAAPGSDITAVSDITVGAAITANSPVAGPAADTLSACRPADPAATWSKPAAAPTAFVECGMPPATTVRDPQPARPPSQGRQP
jgi:probable phosphoglycerate mutase